MLQNNKGYRKFEFVTKTQFVNTNSKYKEDDFTDSDADDYFQDM